MDINTMPETETHIPVENNKKQHNVQLKSKVKRKTQSEGWNN